MMRVVTFAMTLLFTAVGTAWTQEWKDLATGNELKGWKTLSGDWSIQDGVISGTAKPDENTWLMYDAGEFADFEIELEFQTPVPTNGGLQFRSHWLPAVPLPKDVKPQDAPRVMYGYQANVETRERTGTGKLVDENGRGPLAETDMATAKTLHQKTWNKMRVVARGKSIEIYLHDVLACKYEDEAFISGYIGLQSYAMGSKEATTVQYRNIRIKDSGREGNWRTLFNGKDLDTWEIYGEEEWAVEDGIIIGRSGPKKSEGYLATKEQWEDFHVRGTCKMLGDGNFGLFFHSSITIREEDKYPVIAGVQGEVEPSWPGSSGWIYESYKRGWLVEPDHAIMPAFALRPNEWNSIEIRAKGPHTTTWINGIRVLDFEDPKPLLTKGQFALQLHTGGVDGIQWKDLAVKE